MSKAHPSGLLFLPIGLVLFAGPFDAGPLTPNRPQAASLDKIQPPIDLSLDLLEEWPERGLYRLELIVSLRARLQDVRLHLPRSPQLRLLEGRERSIERARPGRLWRETFLVEVNGPGALFLVGVEGGQSGSELYRAASLWLGEPSPRKLDGTEWTDDRGRTYFVVSAAPAP